MFVRGWDEMIAYTWGETTYGGTGTGRWLMPAQYWSAKVIYPDFSVDYYFVDSNVHETFPPDTDPRHNICSREHNPEKAGCWPQGPVSLEHCPAWFTKLWNLQMRWLNEKLAKSEADWQIVVTHFPPNWGKKEWQYLCKNHGIDLIISGHVHVQRVYPQGPRNFLGDTATIISGGGGGMTSENCPREDGMDDQYGFVDLTLSKQTIKIEMISHAGHLRNTTLVQQRLAQGSDGPPPWNPTLSPASDKFSDTLAMSDHSSNDCATYGCGIFFMPMQGCQCNPQCVAHDDCCLDFATTCVGKELRQKWLAASPTAPPRTAVASLLWHVQFSFVIVAAASLLFFTMTFARYSRAFSYSSVSNSVDPRELPAFSFYRPP